MSIAAKFFNRAILNRFYDEVSPFQGEFRRGEKFY